MSRCIVPAFDPVPINGRVSLRGRWLGAYWILGWDRKPQTRVVFGHQHELPARERRSARLRRRRDARKRGAA